LPNLVNARASASRHPRHAGIAAGIVRLTARPNADFEQRFGRWSQICPVPGDGSDGTSGLSSFLLNSRGKPMRPEVVIPKSRLVASGDLTTEEQS